MSDRFPSDDEHLHPYPGNLKYHKVMTPDAHLEAAKQKFEMPPKPWKWGDMSEFVDHVSAQLTKEFERNMIEWAKSFRPKWVSVKDSLPETNVDVLVHGYYGYSVAKLTPHDFWCFDEGVLDEPTHWMPLPEPPEE